LQAHKLYLKKSKCFFGARSVAYLSHVISADGVAMDGEKVQVVLSWPPPTTVRAVCAFLGLAGYYRRFIKDYGATVAPLTQLLRKDNFRWSAEAAAAFRTLQRALTMVSVLRLPAFDSEFVIECDASGSGIGAVLHQGDGPIAFFSHPMVPRHAKLAAYERELIGLVQAVRHWRAYLWGRSFLVRTDHYSLKFLLDQRLSTIPQHQWASKLLGFDFRVEYKPGKMNVVANALSRRDTETSAEAMALSAPSFQLFKDLRAVYTTDATLTSLRQEVRDGLRGKQWAVVDDLVTRGGCIYVPAFSPLVEELLTTAHGAGHEGTQKTLHRLHADFFVPGARTIVQNFVCGYVTCQKNKTEHLHPAGLLQSLGVLSTIWTDISMDFIEGFHKINGKSVILTVVDRFSKAAHFITLGHPYTATTVARAFFTEIVRLHGILSSIVNDRDPTFTSNFWQELFKLSGVRLQMSSSFHPQSDGQTEVVNKIITMYLRCLTGDQPRQWLQWLPWAEFCYNSAYQSSLRTSPFRVVFGRDPPPPPSARTSQARRAF
jgi:hypothetical protein